MDSIHSKQRHSTHLTRNGIRNPEGRLWGVPHSAVPALPIQDTTLKETKCKLLVCTSQAVPSSEG